MAPLPIQKIIFVAIKQMISPLATRLVLLAEVTPPLRKYVLTPIGQARHRLDVVAMAWRNDRRKPEFIPPLTEEKAVKKGADIFLHVTIFSLAVVIWIYDSRLSNQKESDKHSMQNERIADLANSAHLFKQAVAERALYIEEVGERIKQMENRVKLLESR